MERKPPIVNGNEDTEITKFFTSSTKLHKKVIEPAFKMRDMELMIQKKKKFIMVGFDNISNIVNFLFFVLLPKNFTQTNTVVLKNEEFGQFMRLVPDFVINNIDIEYFETVESVREYEKEEKEKKKKEKERMLTLVVNEELFKNEETVLWANYSLMRSDRIFCDISFDQLIKRLETPLSIVWFTSDKPLLRSNVILDLVKIGEILEHEDLMDRTFLKTYPAKKIMSEIIENRVLLPREKSWFPLVSNIRIEEEEGVDPRVELVVSGLMNYVYSIVKTQMNKDRVIVRELMKHYSLMEKKFITETEIDNEYIEMMNWLVRLSKYFELMYYESPLDTFNLIVKTIEEMEGEFSDRNNERIPKMRKSLEKVEKTKTSYVVDLANSLLLETEMDSKKLSLIVVPYHRVESMEELRKSFESDKIFVSTLIEEDNYGKLFIEITEGTKRGVKVFIIDEKQFTLSGIPSRNGLSVFHTVHLFPYKFLYSLYWQKRVIKFLKPELFMKRETRIGDYIKVYFSNNRIDSLLVREIRKRKWIFTKSLTNPIRWLKEKNGFAIDIPRIMFPGLSVAEPKISSNTIYDIVNLTPMEFIKIFSVYDKSYARKLDYINALFHSLTRWSLSKPMEFFVRKIPNLPQLVERFLKTKVYVGDRDITAAIQLIRSLWRIQGTDRFITTVISLIYFCLKSRPEKMGQGQNFRRSINTLKFFCDGVLNWGRKKQYTEICVKTSQLLGTKFKIGEFSKEELAKMEKGSIKAAKVVSDTYLLSPHFLVFLLVLSNGTEYGLALFRPRLLNWYELYEGFEDKEIQEMMVVVKTVLDYIRKRSKQGSSMVIREIEKIKFF